MSHKNFITNEDGSKNGFFEDIDGKVYPSYIPPPLPHTDFPTITLNLEDASQFIALKDRVNVLENIIINQNKRIDDLFNIINNDQPPYKKYT